MKKILILLICAANLHANTLLEFRTSYFYPTSSKYSGVNYQITGAVPVYCNVNLWGAVDYFEKDEIRIIPATLGLKYFFPNCGFYAAAGAKYYYVHTHNNSEFVRNTINKYGFGGVVEAGFIANITCNWVLDIFSSYSFKSLKAPSISNPAVEGKSLNISGFNFGAGIGYYFN